MRHVGILSVALAGVPAAGVAPAAGARQGAGMAGAQTAGFAGQRQMTGTLGLGGQETGTMNR